MEEVELTPEGQPKIAQHEHAKGKPTTVKRKPSAKPGKVGEPAPQMFLFGEKAK